ncbi:amidohydrolase/deacetylase family metallohydrolase [Isosphaeraceae bacterium EP7]
MAVPIKYDMLIRGARLIDPATRIDAVRDVAFAGGLVAEVGTSIDPATASEVIDARGRFLSPGWIDLHTHVYHKVSHFGVDPDVTCLPNGCTTVVDAGTAGSLTFEGFRSFVIDRAKTRVKALVHISGIGLIAGINMKPAFGEIQDPLFLSAEGAVETALAHADVVLGIKVRLMDNISDDGRVEREALRQARAAADAIKKPLMLHPTLAVTPTEEMVEALRPGDVFTHCYHGLSGSILDGRGLVLDSVRAAIERGVRMDVGHGQGSFHFDVAARCLEQGVRPHTISTDLHTYCVDGPVYDLACTMTKFLALGLSVRDVLEMVTSEPASWMGEAGVLGTLAVGAEADAVLFDLEDGDWELVDSIGQVRRHPTRFAVRSVFKGGRKVGDTP